MSSSPEDLAELAAPWLLPGGLGGAGDRHVGHVMAPQKVAHSAFDLALHLVADRPFVRIQADGEVEWSRSDRLEAVDARASIRRKARSGQHEGRQIGGSGPQRIDRRRRGLSGASAEVRTGSVLTIESAIHKPAEGVVRARCS